LFADFNIQVPVADSNGDNHDIAIQLSRACTVVDNSVDSNVLEEIPLLPNIGMHAHFGFFL